MEEAKGGWKKAPGGQNQGESFTRQLARIKPGEWQSAPRTGYANNPTGLKPRTHYGEWQSAPGSASKGSSEEEKQGNSHPDSKNKTPSQEPVKESKGAKPPENQNEEDYYEYLARLEEQYLNSAPDNDNL